MANLVVGEMLMRVLIITGAEEFGMLLAAMGLYAAGASARNNGAKILRALADLGKLEAGPGYYRIPGCKSEYGDHAKLLTQALVKILIKYPNSLINRELTITEAGLRPDALVLLVKDKLACAFVLEVMNNERESYFQEKVRKWNAWAGACDFLSKTLGCQVPHFCIVRDSQLDKFLEES